MTKLPDRYRVTISKTSDGLNDYMQILSADQFATNIVLIAGTIEVNDQRAAQVFDRHLAAELDRLKKK